MFVSVALGSGIESCIDKNEELSIYAMSPSLIQVIAMTMIMESLEGSIYLDQMQRLISLLMQTQAESLIQSMHKQPIVYRMPSELYLDSVIQKTHSQQM